MRVSVVIGAVVLAVLFLPLALGLWVDSRWFAAQDLEQVFTLRLGTQLALGIAAAVAAGVFVAANLAWATFRLRGVASKEDRESRGMSTVAVAVPIASLAVGVIFGLTAFGQWQTLLGFQAQVPFGQTDPSFGQDIAFYVWTLSALSAVRGWLTALLVLTAVGAGIIYALGIASIETNITTARPYPLIARERPLRHHPLLAPGVRHLALLGAAFLLLVGASYWLNNWELVYSNRGVVFGASATDMAAIYPANVIMAGVAGLLALVLLFVAVRPATGASTGFLVTAAAAPILWIAIGFILGEIWP